MAFIWIHWSYVKNVMYYCFKCAEQALIWNVFVLVTVVDTMGLMDIFHDSHPHMAVYIMYWWIKFQLNSSSSGGYGFDFKCVLVIISMDISSAIAFRWMAQDLTDDKSALIQVLAWCCQARSHYMNQCWLRSMMLYDDTRSQWVTPIEIWTKRQLFFLNKKNFLNFIPNSHFFLRIQLLFHQLLFQIMAECQTGKKTKPDSMLTQICNMA